MALMTEDFLHMFITRGHLCNPRVLADGIQLHPLADFPAYHAAHEILCRVGDLRQLREADVARQGVCPLLEWELCVQHDVQHDAKAEDVRLLCIVGASSQHLWRCISQSRLSSLALF